MAEKQPSSAGRRTVVGESLALALLGGLGAFLLVTVSDGDNALLALAILSAAGGIVCLATALPWLVWGLIQPPSPQRGHVGPRLVQLLGSSVIGLVAVMGALMLYRPGSAAVSVFGFIALPAAWVAGGLILWLSSAMSRLPAGAAVQPAAQDAEPGGAIAAPGGEAESPSPDAPSPDAPAEQGEAPPEAHRPGSFGI